MTTQPQPPADEMLMPYYQCPTCRAGLGDCSCQSATPPAAPAEAKRYDIHGKLHRVTGNPVALTEESPSGKWVLASDFDALQSKHDTAVGLLRAFTDAGKEAHDYAMKTGQDRVPAKCWLLLMKFGVLLEENAARIEALATTPKE